MSTNQPLRSAQYLQDEVIQAEIRGQERMRTRAECNRSAEGLMLWGFASVAMCAFALITRSML
jgi:hypothetical protein